MESDNKTKDKKIKNLVSVAILLGGLLLGSLFVDVTQLIKGTGFSKKNLNKSDIFEADGKTWVAYNEPAVTVSVINDDSCDKCDVSEALVWLRRVLPTVGTEKISFDSAEGRAMNEKFGVKILPAFIFDENIAKTDFYAQAKVLFAQKENQYVLNTQELGIPVGKYLELPKVSEGDATFGAMESKAQVFVFSDFQCPYCKLFWQTLRASMKTYSDRVLFDYKHLALDFHPQAMNAALASECALEQGKFWEYGDKLYATQNEWGAAKDTASFKNYARTLGLKTVEFNKCLDDKKYQDKINADREEATGFGISGTPAVFVGENFEAGAISAEQLNSLIDGELSKQ